MGLTTKQSAFVAEYLKDPNPEVAALRAGYSHNTAKLQGSRLLDHAGVRGAISAGLDALKGGRDAVDGYQPPKPGQPALDKPEGRPPKPRPSYGLEGGQGELPPAGAPIAVQEQEPTQVIPDRAVVDANVEAGRVEARAPRPLAPSEVIREARDGQLCGNCRAFVPHGYERKRSRGDCLLNPQPVPKLSAQWCEQWRIGTTTLH